MIRPGVWLFLMCVACARPRPNDPPAATHYNSIADALAHIPPGQPAPLYVVDGILRADTLNLPPAAAVRSVELIYSVSSGHCRVEYMIEGQCRPVLAITTRRSSRG
jgi:hypothetical protein